MHFGPETFSEAWLLVSQCNRCLLLAHLLKPRYSFDILPLRARKRLVTASAAVLDVSSREFRWLSDVKLTRINFYEAERHKFGSIADFLVWDDVVHIEQPVMKNVEIFFRTRHWVSSRYPRRQFEVVARVEDSERCTARVTGDSSNSWLETCWTTWKLLLRMRYWWKK